MPRFPRRSLTFRGFFRDALSRPAGLWATLSHLMRVSGQPSRVPGALARGAVFFGVLAVIAGIFGMHVMTGSHAAHTSAGHAVVGHAASPSYAVTGDAHASHSAAGHAAAADDGGGQPGGPAHPGGDAAVVLAANGVCAETCPGAEEPGASCVPSPNSGTLAVIAPPSAAVEQPRAWTATAGSGYSYIPSGPTPCELSISRT